ncbi:MAG: PIN domain-containing protein [Polyangiaceae bacterium]|nr:PIN domain-containing protein [Polyangiaceae bacterium]
MIAVDTNVLIYADRAEMPLHRQAIAALRRLAEGTDAWALPIFCAGEFLRVVSHHRVFDPPTPTAEALDSLDSLLASPSVRVLVPGDQYMAVLRRLLIQSAAAGNHVFDAQIAAVCLEHGARTLLTEDRDFSRFPGLAVQSLTAFVGR